MRRSRSARGVGSNSSWMDRWTIDSSPALSKFQPSSGMQPFGQLLQSFDDARPRTINQVGSDPDYSIRPDSESHGEIAPQVGFLDELGAVARRGDDYLRRARNDGLAGKLRVIGRLVAGDGFAARDVDQVVDERIPARRDQRADLQHV